MKNISSLLLFFTTIDCMKLAEPIFFTSTLPMATLRATPAEPAGRVV